MNGGMARSGTAFSFSWRPSFWENVRFVPLRDGIAFLPTSRGLPRGAISIPRWQARATVLP